MSEDNIILFRNYSERLAMQQGKKVSNEETKDHKIMLFNISSDRHNLGDIFAKCFNEEAKEQKVPHISAIVDSFGTGHVVAVVATDTTEGVALEKCKYVLSMALMRSLASQYKTSPR